MKPTRGEEQALFRNIAKGETDPSVAVERYLYLADYASRRYIKHREEVYQECAMALHRIVDRFDIERGLRFSTYAAPRLRGVAMDWMYAHGGGVVRIPGPVNKIMHRLSQGLDVDCAPSARARAKDLIGQEYLSVDKFNEPGVCDPEPDGDVRLLLDTAIATLSPRQAEAIRLYYLDELTGFEVAARMGITPAGVHQLLKLGRDNLRTVTLENLTI